MRLHIGPIIVIAIGLIFLLVNLGYVPAAEIRALLSVWWPVVLIVVGVLALLRPRRQV